MRKFNALSEMSNGNRGVEPGARSCTSFNELARDGHDIERHNRLHPEAEPRSAYVAGLLQGRQGPAIAATDYVRAYPEQIHAYVPMRYTVLGTDGCGRSDTRENLRRHFVVDRFHIAQAAITALAAEGQDDGPGRGAGDQALQDRCGEAESGWGLSVI